MNSCVEEEPDPSTVNAVNIQERKSELANSVNSILRYTRVQNQVTITPEQSNFGNFFVNVTMTGVPYNTIRMRDYNTDITALRGSLAGTLSQILNLKYVDAVELHVQSEEKKLLANPRGQVHILSSTNDSVLREITKVNMTVAQYNRYKEIYEDYNEKLKEHVVFYPFFKIELKLKIDAKNVQNILVGQDTDNETGKIRLDMRYEPTNFGCPNSPSMDCKSEFEEEFTKIIRYSFEGDSTVDSINIIAQLPEFDTRTENNLSQMASYNATREEFDSIMQKWDDFKFKIIDKINYTDIFLADLVAGQRLISMRGDEDRQVNLSYDHDYYTASYLVTAIEKDSMAVISSLFDYDEDLDRIRLNFRAKIPATEEGKKVDDVHMILYDAFTVDVSRSEYEKLNLDNLNDQQALYNLDIDWADEISTLNVKERIKNYFERQNAAFKDSRIRGIEYSPDKKEMTVILDGCLFNNFFVSLRQGETGQGNILKASNQLVKELMFNIHPPFLDTITIRLERVYLDQTGNEDIKDLGEIVYERGEDATFWFRSEDFSEEEYFDMDEDLDIDTDEKLCQQ